MEMGQRHGRREGVHAIAARHGAVRQRKEEDVHHHFLSRGVEKSTRENKALNFNSGWYPSRHTPPLRRTSVTSEIDGFHHPTRAPPFFLYFPFFPSSPPGEPNTAPTTRIPNSPRRPSLLTWSALYGAAEADPGRKRDRSLAYCAAICPAVSAPS